MGVPQSKTSERNKINFVTNNLINSDTAKKVVYSDSDVGNLKIKKYFTSNENFDANYLSNCSNSNSNIGNQLKKSKIMKKFKDQKRILNMSHVLINNIMGLKSAQENNLNFLKIFDIDSNIKKNPNELSFDIEKKFVNSIFEFFSTKESKSDKKFLINENNSLNISYLLNFLDSNSTLFCLTDKKFEESLYKSEDKKEKKDELQFEPKVSNLSIPNDGWSNLPNQKIISHTSINLNPNLKTIKLNFNRNNSNTNFTSKLIITKDNSNNMISKSPTKNISNVIQRTSSKSPLKEKSIIYSKEIRAKSPTNSMINKSNLSSKNQPNTKILKIDLRKKHFSPIKISSEYICNTEVAYPNSPTGLSGQFIYAKKKVDSNMNSKFRSESSSKNSLNSKVISNICNSYHTENNSIFSNLESIQAYDILSLKERNYANQSSYNSYLEIMKKRKEIEELNMNISRNMRNKSPAEKRGLNTIHQEGSKYMMKSNRSSDNLKRIGSERNKENVVKKYLQADARDDASDNDSLSILNKYTTETMPDEDLMSDDNFNSTFNSCFTTKNKSNMISLQSTECSKKSSKNLEKLNILRNLKTKIKSIEKEKIENNDYEVNNYDAITNSRKYLDIITESTTNEIDENEALNSNRYSSRMCQTPKFDSDGKRFSFNMMNGNKKQPDCGLKYDFDIKEKIEEKELLDVNEMNESFGSSIRRMADLNY